MTELAIPLIGPMLRDDLPRYPPLLQLIRVTTSTITGPGGSPPLHTSYTEQLRTDTLAPRDRESCLAVDVNGGGLAAGYYLGRLAGSFNNLPVYEVVGALTSTVDYTSSTVIYNNTTVNYNTTTTTVNYNVSAIYNIANYRNITYNGPGYYIVNAPLYISGYLLWNCAAATLPSASTSNYALPSAATVFNLTAPTAATVLSGIQPQPSGTPVNTGAVTNATNASPIVLTVPGWTVTPVVNQAVTVAGILGNTAANGTWTVQAVTGTTLTLKNSTGNGAFVASPNSEVQIAGPQLIVIRNVGTNTIVIPDAGSAGATGSDQANRIRIPAIFLKATTPELILEQYDAAILWWDKCTGYQWAVISTTVSGIYGQHGGSSQTVLHRRINFIDSASVTWTISDNAAGDSIDMTAAATGGGGGSHINGQAIQGFAYTVTTSMGNVTNGTVTLANIGTYYLSCCVQFALTAPSANAVLNLNAQLVDATVAGNLTSLVSYAHVNVLNGDLASHAGTSVSCIITTTQTNEVINLQADYILLSGTAPGITVSGFRLDYIQIA